MQLPDWKKLKLNITPHSVLALLRLASEVIPKLPQRGDPPWTVGIKLLALLDSTNKAVGASSILTDLRVKLDLKERRSDAFVRLFFNTDLSHAFEAKRIKVDEHLDLIEVADQDGERIFFQEEHWTRTAISSDLLHTPKFNFRQAVTRIWHSYPDGVYMTLVERNDGWGGREAVFCQLPANPVPYLSHAARERLDKLATTHAARRKHGKHRTYFLIGPPGSGKTTFTSQLSARFGGRLLALDAASLPFITAPDLGFLIDMLQPGFVLIDDIDRAPIEEVKARMLFLLPYLKRTCPDTTLVITANDPSKLDPAMLRPDRIDQPIELVESTKEEREELMRALLVHYKVTLSEEQSTRLMTETAHFTYAFLNDLFSRLQEEPLEEVLPSLELLHKLAEQAKASGPQLVGGTPGEGKAVPKG